MTYEEIYDFETLYAAYLAARKGKRKKQRTLEFEENLLENLKDISDDLTNGVYAPGEFERFKIFEPKERGIEAPAFKDKVVLHAVTDNGLYDAITSSFVRNNCANQRGKGTADAVIRLKQCFVHYYAQHKTADGWIIKCDIRHFFASIDHDILKAKLRKVVEKHGIDLRIYDLLCVYIDKAEGLPLGYQTSQLFALLMLDALDHYIEEELGFRFHVRGMDDFVALAPSREDAVRLLDAIREAVHENKLELNKKTAIFPMRNGVDFLGYHTYLTETGAVVQKLRKSSIQRIRKRIKRWRHDYAEGKITAEKIKSSFLAWDAHAAFGDTYALRQKYAKEVGEIIGEPVRTHRKLNSTRIQREKRREKQYRCIAAKRKRQFAMQAGYSRPGAPPWSEQEREGVYANCKTWNKSSRQYHQAESQRQPARVPDHASGQPQHQHVRRQLQRHLGADERSLREPAVGQL